MEQESNSTDIEDIYAAFDSDQDLEKRGVPIDYGKFVVDIARAGGSNDEYARVFEDTFKDVKAAMEVNDLSEAEARVRFHTVYIRSIIKRWRFKETVGNEQILVQGLGRKNGEIVEASEVNLKALFKAKPDLFMRIRKDAEQREVFASIKREAIAKN